MFGLRKSFAARKLRKRSSESSIPAESIDGGAGEESSRESPRAGMDTIRAGLQESMTGFVGGKGRKSADSVSVAVTAVTADSNDMDKMAPAVTSSQVVRTSSTTTVRVVRITETTKRIRGDIRKLGECDDSFFHSVDIGSYLEYISEQRLIHMPRRGSDWDRVLKSAQFFGLQLWRLGFRVGSFCPGAEEAAVTALASTQILLEIGPQQVSALMPTFEALYRLALLVSHVYEIDGVFEATPDVKEAVAHLYCDMVELVGSIAVSLRQKIGRLRAGQSIVVDFEDSFGAAMSNVWRRRDVVISKMWSLKLGQRAGSHTLQALRLRLQQDRSAIGSFFDQVAESIKRAEDTCEWFSGPLTSFFRSTNKAFTITGDRGCGKTVLAGWIKERLERPVDHKHYTTLTYQFSYDDRHRTTVAAFLKGVLAQLLDKNVGDVELYENLANAFDSYDKHHNESELEQSLWAAFESGLRTLNQRDINLAIIVDGFHEVTGGTTPQDFHKRLREIVGKFKTTRLITLSQPISHLSNGCQHFTITAHDLHADLLAYFRQSLGRFSCFKQLGSDVQHKIVHDLTHRAKASFLWAYIVVHLLAKDVPSMTPAAFAKAAGGINFGVDEAIKKLVEKQTLKNETTQSLLSFMLVADRPLAVAEVAELLRLNLKSKKLDSDVAVVKHIKATCDDIVIVENGKLRLKNMLIATYLVSLMGSQLPSQREAHRRLTLALLLYSKLILHDKSGPSFELVPERTLDEFLGSHSLLYYALRHWQSHFRCSTFFTEGEIVVNKDFDEFRGVFPESCQFVVFERTTCSHGRTPFDLIEHQKLSLRIREACFGEKHVSVLQSLIILGTLHVHVSEVEHGVTFYYRASSLGKLLLSLSHPVVVACVNYVLQYTETITITKRTTIVTYREEMILFMIEICKEKHGEHSDLVIKWYETLAQLYVCIEEKEKATKYFKILYDIVVVRFGRKSPEASHLCEYMGDLEFVVLPDTDKKQVEEYTGLLLETTEELEESDERRVSILLTLAGVYVTHKEWFLAEKVYITLWRHISEVCRLKGTIDLHITKIKIAIEYVEFLRARGRSSEAANILVCLWLEYEHHASFDHKEIILLMKRVGSLFKSCGLLDLAVSVLTKVWGWFKTKGSVTGKEAEETTVLITEVTEEVTETIKTTKTTKTVTTEVTETLVREVYETHFHRCKGGKADKAFFGACRSLVSLYLGLKNWAKAEIVITQSLEITWKAILTADVNIKLSGEFITECIEIATSLAICYQEQHSFEKAEAIYLRIFYACIASFKIDDVRVEKALEVLIRFYDHHHRHEKVLEIYIDILAKYRKALGDSHRLTIKVLFALAGHYKLLGRNEAYDYYLEIVTVLNKGHKHCHPDAFGAAVILLHYYHERQHWAKLQQICAVLWETFVHHHKTVTWTAELVQVLYERYVHVLEFHAKVEISVLYELTVQYRKTVSLHFEADSLIWIKALIALGDVCARDEKHLDEAVTIYEEVLTRITTTKTIEKTVVEEITTTVKTKVSKVYVTIIHGKTKPSTETVERAIEFALEAYARLRIKHGHWHEKTLGELKTIVVLYLKLGKEWHSNIVELLHAAFIGVATAKCSTLELYKAAALLAGIYVTAGLSKLGLQLAHRLRHLAIFGHDFDVTGAELSVKLDVVIAKTSFVFVVAFEQHLLDKVVMSYSELMAVMLLEMTLYEQYKRVISVKTTDIEIILEWGAKLRLFWVEQKQVHLIQALDKRLFAIFKDRYSSYLVTHDEYTHVFYLALLGALGRDLTKIDFKAVVCRSGNARVRSLLDAGEFKRALEVARCVFHFAHRQGYYSDLSRVHYAYQLAELMAGIDVKKPTGDSKLWDEFLRLSKEITAEALAIFRAKDIDLVRLRFKDLSGIVRLLGNQQNYVELEALLLKLWQSREVQRSWDAIRVLSIGRLMVHAHVAANHIPAAIELCETMCYNLRRSRGVLDPVTVEMLQMLAALYTSDGRVERCMVIHEQVLREIDAALHEGGQGEYGAGWRPAPIYYQGKGGKSAQQTVKPEELAKTAGWQLELLKRAHTRMGGWSKPEYEQEYSALYSRLSARFGKDALQVAAPETWSKTAAENKGKPDDHIGKYVGPAEWKLEEESPTNGVSPAGDANGKLLQAPPPKQNGANGRSGLFRSGKRKSDIDHIMVAAQEWLVA